MRRRDIQITKLAHSLDEFSPDTRKAAAAITMTEMYFRPFPARVVEYFYVVLLFLFRRNYSTVSVGISQVSLRHIGETHGKMDLGLLLIASNPKKIMKECCLLLSNSNDLSAQNLAKNYNGKSTLFYTTLLEANLISVKDIWAKIDY